MTSYVVRRLVYALITFLGITVATFALIHAVPGDPVTFYLARAGMYVPADILEAVRREYHLDEPLPIQYLYWLRGVVTLDFGRSVVDHRPVVERIFEKLPNSFQLNLIAFVISALIGIPIGLWSASRSGRLSERASAIGFFLLYSLPAFWVGLMLVQIFAMRLQILPLFGMTSDGYEALSLGEQILDRAKHLILPVITLSYAQIALFARFSKSALSDVIRQDFITTARAKGATESTIVWHHAFRNALIPLITLLGLTIPYLISGSVIVEYIFQWDGIGSLYVDAIYSRDYPTVMALTVATALVTLFASLLADLLYAAADPRVRIEGRRR